ncbi:hypothetical protein PENTCL1PPCAC_16942 [Pristionchus entomophagus]|uniref:NR LBD domain-containing protein n=1 Tax=Pristionchus entomophagus TaxID=358040 RepID=A0AAV5TK18_9BILA|nr:hypothetical protein PENTCL1PPCAC_16942 [Pristionchus entomophagus]
MEILILVQCRRYIKDSNFQVKEIAGARKLIARLKPHNEEFLAVIGLMFWTVDGINVSQAISTIAEHYTKQILNEIHSFYREVLKLDDYATRLGELLLLIQVFDVKILCFSQLSMILFRSRINTRNTSRCCGFSTSLMTILSFTVFRKISRELLSVQCTCPPFELAKSRLFFCIYTVNF